MPQEVSGMGGLISVVNGLGGKIVITVNSNVTKRQHPEAFVQLMNAVPQYRSELAQKRVHAERGTLTKTEKSIYYDEIEGADRMQNDLAKYDFDEYNDFDLSMIISWGYALLHDISSKQSRWTSDQKTVAFIKIYLRKACQLYLKAIGNRDEGLEGIDNFIKEARQTVDNPF